VTVQPGIVVPPSNVQLLGDNANLTTGVQVAITPSGTDAVTTTGNYTVSASSAGTYTVTPSKVIHTGLVDIRPAGQKVWNVKDVQAIQAHIGSGAKLTTTPQLIAANVVLATGASNETNHRLNTADWSALAQFINGVPNNLDRFRWRFIPTDLVPVTPVSTAPRSFSFVPAGGYLGSQNGTNYGTYPESRTTTLSGSETGQDFTAIRIGDVVQEPGVPLTPFGNDPDARYAGAPLVWRVNDSALEKGRTIEATFRAGQLTELKGWQFGLHFDPEYLELEDLITTKALPMDPEVNFGLYQADQGNIRSLWSDAEKQSLKRDEPVFTLRFKALQSGVKLSDVLRLDEAVQQSFALSPNLDEVAVMLSFDGSRAFGKEPILYQNTPNPFDKETRVRFELPTDSDIQLSIHDVTGRLIQEFNGFYSEGLHEVIFNRGQLGKYSGVLYYTLRCGDFTATRRMIVIE
jgi:hypothetical protein